MKPTNAYSKPLDTSAKTSPNWKFIITGQCIIFSTTLLIKPQLRSIKISPNESPQAPSKFTSTLMPLNAATSVQSLFTLPTNPTVRSNAIFIRIHPSYRLNSRPFTSPPPLPPLESYSLFRTPKRPPKTSYNHYTKGKSLPS